MTEQEERHERMKKCIADIKDIARLLDPEGMAWADEQKAMRMAEEMIYKQGSIE